MSTGKDFINLYDDYYTSGSVDKKRYIAAIQSVGHIKKMVDLTTCKSLLDIGAGNGSVIQAISSEEFDLDISAVEISQSGVEAINNRNIPRLKKVEKFDGYKINADDNQFDLGISVHVLEHVEHERLFLHEAARVSKKLFIEVPLEHTSNIDKSIRMGRPYGHINYYTKATIKNLIETSGLEIENIEIFSHDLAYETYVAGNKLKGKIKHGIRTSALSVLPTAAERRFVYMAGITCKKSNREFEFKGH